MNFKDSECGEAIKVSVARYMYNYGFSRSHYWNVHNRYIVCSIDLSICVKHNTTLCPIYNVVVLLTIRRVLYFFLP